MPPIDAGLYNAFAPRQKSVADYDADALRAREGNMALQQNALALQTSQMQLQDRQRALAEQDQVRSALLKANPDVASRIGALEGTGLQSGYDMADKLRKATADQEKTNAETGLTKAKTTGALTDSTIKATEFMARSLGDVKNPTQLAQWYKTGIDQGLIKPEQAQAEFSQIPINDPQAMQQWIAQKQSQGVSLVEKMKLKQQQDQLAETTRHNKSNEGIQIRGQNMTDARSRESTAATMTKPFEVTGPDGAPILVQQDRQGNISPVQGFGPKSGASKPLTDSQAKALLFGTRMQESDKILGQLDGKYSPTAIGAKSVADQVGGLTGMIGSSLVNKSMSEQTQQAEQAQRDFINAVLRRESGAAIANSEFDNARKQYFPQPNDSDAVKSQKARNRQIAIQGLLAEVPQGQRGSVKVPEAAPAPSSKSVVRTGTHNGKKVVQYSDGTVSYAD